MGVEELGGVGFFFAPEERTGDWFCDLEVVEVMLVLKTSGIGNLEEIPPFAPVAEDELVERAVGPPRAWTPDPGEDDDGDEDPLPVELEGTTDD